MKVKDRYRRTSKDYELDDLFIISDEAYAIIEALDELTTAINKLAVKNG